MVDEQLAKLELAPECSRSRRKLRRLQESRKSHLCLGSIADERRQTDFGRQTWGRRVDRSRLGAAQQCALNVLAHLKAALAGDWTRFVQVVRIGGFVNCTPDFDDAPKVVNGASDLMVKVFGPVGAHARAAVGVASFPLACRWKSKLFSRFPKKKRATSSHGATKFRHRGPLATCRKFHRPGHGVKFVSAVRVPRRRIHVAIGAESND